MKEGLKKLGKGLLKSLPLVSELVHQKEKKALTPDGKIDYVQLLITYLFTFGVIGLGIYAVKNGIVEDLDLFFKLLKQFAL